LDVDLNIFFFVSHALTKTDGGAFRFFISLLLLFLRRPARARKLPSCFLR